MSSDVQAESGSLRGAGGQPLSSQYESATAALLEARLLEDLAEASDETEAAAPASSALALAAAATATATPPPANSTAAAAGGRVGVTSAPERGRRSRLLVVEDANDPDVLYIPLGLTLGLASGNPRHSFPPARDLLPYQHVMRSFSDSQLCLKLAAACCAAATSCAAAASASTPSDAGGSTFPCGGGGGGAFASPASSSPSILVLDVTNEQSVNGVQSSGAGASHPLRRTRGTQSLLATDNRPEPPPSPPTIDEEEDARSLAGSWCSGGDLVLEGCWWDADYVQHWLRLDETRSALQQQHRDLLELEYDRSELEDWSMSLSCEDLPGGGGVGGMSQPQPSPMQQPHSLPSIQEHGPSLELEEDASECLWNKASFLVEGPGAELAALLLDGGGSLGCHGIGGVGAGLGGDGNGVSHWPYALAPGAPGSFGLASPAASWSSHSEDCCHAFDCCGGSVGGGGTGSGGGSGSGVGAGGGEDSKRSSAAMSGCSDDAASGESPAVGTDFTRDFYRLVKFESTKSLASTSSRSLVTTDAACPAAQLPAPPPPSTAAQAVAAVATLGSLGSLARAGLPPERELALQSVLSFIAEQQQYCASREQDDLCHGEGEEEEVLSEEVRDCEGASRSPSSPEHDADVCSNDLPVSSDGDSGASSGSGERKMEREIVSRASPEGGSSVVVDVTSGEIGQRGKSEEQLEALIEQQLPQGENETRVTTTTSAGGVTAASATASNRKRERLTEAMRNEHNNRLIQEMKEGGCPPLQSSEENVKMKMEPAVDLQVVNDHVMKAGPALNSILDVKESTTSMLFNGSSYEIERSALRQRRTKEDELEERLGRRSTTEVLVTVFEEEHEDEVDAGICRSMTESFTSTVSTPDTVVCPATGSSILTNGGTKRPPQSQCSQVSPDAAVSPFHERTSSKDVIDELNRMIRKGEDSIGVNEGEMSSARLDVACCCPTGWVHVERDIDFTDPKARANLLDVMLASSGSSGNSSGSSSGGGTSSSSSSESGEEPADYQHLHRLHRFRRQKKASATREQLGVLRYPASTPRPSILGRDDFYVRYGDKEREAVASFDFLEDLSTTSVSGASSCDTLGSHNRPPLTPATAPSSAQPSAGTTPSSSEDCNPRSPMFTPLMETASTDSKHFFSPSIESGEV